MGWVALGQVLLGFVVLIVGADVLVRGAAGLALRLRISPLVVGLTVVAFGTSAPELAVSLWASVQGQADIAVGNVVGSNVLNVLLILGLSAAIAPLAVERVLVRADLPLLAGASVATLLFALDGALARGECTLLVGGVVGYLLLLARRARQGRAAVEVPEAAASEAPWKLLLFIVVGLVALVAGSRLLVAGATAIAAALGVTDLVIGLTVVALGTSLPEVATSVVAAVRGARDIAVGNVVGSNLFNLLVVLGLSGLAAPAGLAVAPNALAFDLPLMVGVAFGAWLLAATGRRVGRAEGALLLAGYLAYTGLLLVGVRAMAPLGWAAAAALVVAVAVWDAYAARQSEAPAA